MTGLVRRSNAPELLSKARALLAEAKTLEDALRVRTAAKTAESFFRAAQQAPQLANEAVEIRLRAERKAGELLIEMAERGERAGKGGDQRSSNSVLLDRLSHLGITKIQSSRWQESARIALDFFENYIAATRKSEAELTAAGLREQASWAEEQKEKRTLVRRIRREAVQYPEGPYRVLAVDPPWPYESRGEDPTHRARNPYPGMTLNEIYALPVGKLAHDDSIVWLWATNAFLCEAFACLDEWGFEYKTLLTWIKDRMGLGNWLRGQTEHCLMGVRGAPIVTLTNQTTALHGQLREHSRKPEEFYALVEALCPGNRVEFFSRTPRAGWTAWGAEKAYFEAGE